MDYTNRGYVYLFHHISSPPHYDWSGLVYIQPVCQCAAWYKWIIGRSSQLLSHNHTVHTQNGELQAQGSTTSKTIMWSTGAFSLSVRSA